MDVGTFNTSAQAVALSGAFVYFLYKLVNGVYLYTLVLNIRYERRLARPGSDYLLISVSTKAGAISTVELHDIQARVSYSVDGANKKHIVRFEGIERPGHQKRDHRFAIVWDGIRPLRIRQGEEPTFSALLEVPSSAACFVEVSVIGKRAFVGLLPGKWKATAHVLPQEATLLALPDEAQRNYYGQ